MQELEQIAMKWFDAFNTKRLDNLLSLYDDEARHYSPKLKISKPETEGLIIGKSALYDWWQDAFERLPSLHYQPTSFTANSNRVFMEYTRRVEGENDLQVAEVLEIKEGKIVFSRVYHG
ncbi:MAG: nuclear transport factor 2 family protein [Flavobacterium sp.]